MIRLLPLLFVACAGGPPAPEVGLVPPASASEPPGTGADPSCAVEPLATWEAAIVSCPDLGYWDDAVAVALYPAGGGITFDTADTVGLAVVATCIVTPRTP